MELVHCIYCSASAKKDQTPKELAALLEQCRRSNARLGVTGVLLYQEGSFFQVLEGDREVVEALYAKIATDPRHSRVTKIVVEPIEERSFAEWTMGHARATRAELAAIPGLNDFFTRGTSYLDIGEGRAKKLVAAFREGRWRAAIE